MDYRHYYRHLLQAVLALLALLARGTERGGALPPVLGLRAISAQASAGVIEVAQVIHRCCRLACLVSSKVSSKFSSKASSKRSPLRHRAVY
jgi:hypothetical protein